MAHRSLSLSVFVEIADGFVGELLCILQYLVGFLVCFAQNFVLALIYALVFLLELFLKLFNLSLVAVDFKLFLFDSLSLLLEACNQILEIEVVVINPAFCILDDVFVQTKL